MSFAKGELATATLELPSVVKTVEDMGFPDIAEGLHALAQPLSGLRSAVELMNLLPAGDGERYREMCATEIERACEMFACLQTLVSLKSTEAKMSSFDCRKLMLSMIAEYGLSDRLSESFLAATGPASDLVKGDLERTRQAFASLLTVLARICGTTGTMEASCWTTDASLVFRFKTGDGRKQNLNSGNRLHLSLVRASMLSQNGYYHSHADAFAISVALPLAQRLQMNQA